MYRVVVKSRGKYDNASLGARYCFTKRSVINLAAHFIAEECECEVEKFIRIHHDIFCWSSVEVTPNVWDKIYGAAEKIIMEED